MCPRLPPHLSTCMEATTQGLQIDRFPDVYQSGIMGLSVVTHLTWCSQRQVAAQRRGAAVHVHFNHLTAPPPAPSPARSSPVTIHVLPSHPRVRQHHHLSCSQPKIPPSHSQPSRLNLQFHSVQFGRPPARPRFFFSHPRQ